MIHPIQKIVAQHRHEPEKGIYSVCSANRYVLEAAMRQAKADASLLLVEATSNQVDQFGGYTGMTPADFYAYVRNLAQKSDFPIEFMILGGDHLGPNIWQNQSETEAMALARDQIAAYVQAGFTKIHLDASMPLYGDPVTEGLPLDARLVARRTAELAQAAEQAYMNSNANGPKPVYVIGTDVPIPGGAKESLNDLRITPVDEVQEVIGLTRQAFEEKGLDEAWQRVIAVVVQPGVEFGDAQVAEYDPQKATALSAFIAQHPQLVYEAHSTDYQRPEALKQMVHDHFAILKVGPWLTFAFREAVFALAFMERELFAGSKNARPSRLLEIIDQVMQENPKHWQKHYSGSEKQIALARKFSFSDRILYYWPVKKISNALDRLIQNLNQTRIPLSLLSQFLPSQYRAVREGEISASPVELIYHKIQEVLTIYARAAKMRNSSDMIHSNRTRSIMETL